MFINTPTGPTTATVQQSIWDFQCRAFSRPQTLYSLLLSPSSKAKKGNMNRGRVQNAMLFMLFSRIAWWFMKYEGFHVLLFNIQKLRKQCIELGELGVCKGPQRKTVWANFDRQGTQCVLQRGKCILFFDNFIYYWVTTVSRMSAPKTCVVKTILQVVNYISAPVLHMIEIWHLIIDM